VWAETLGTDLGIWGTLWIRGWGGESDLLGSSPSPITYELCDFGQVTL
jgi:hypothetical protein